MPRRLSEEFRSFAVKVAQAGFSNPFGPERERIDRELAGAASGDGVLEGALRGIDSFIERVTGGRAYCVDIRSYGEEDGRLLLMVVLFRTFHRYIREMDSFITEQMKAGEKPASPRFWRALVRDLEGWGIEREECLRYLAIFYQLRRAYYFISRHLAGKSASMSDLRRKLWNNLFTTDMRLYGKYLWNRLEDFSTLFVGETGTGKGVAAAAIGRAGYIPFDERKECFTESFMRSFVAINLSQFPESLIESELFGHRKGAFTGAIESHEGVFSLCSPHGAIFLDEIGEVSVPVQIKLLNVLQERVFSPVGSHEKLRFQGRVIAATNRKLRDMRGPAGLRDDFFYRLCSDVIEVPPLRQRIAENPDEIREILGLIVLRLVGRDEPELREWILERIERSVDRSYSWPGNVRELEQAARRILITGEYRPDNRQRAASLTEKLGKGIEAGSYTARDLLGDYCRLLYQRCGAYTEVARITGLDRRTVKRHVEGERNAFD